VRAYLRGKICFARRASGANRGLYNSSLLALLALRELIPATPQPELIPATPQPELIPATPQPELIPATPQYETHNSPRQKPTGCFPSFGYDYFFKNYCRANTFL